MKYCTIGMKSDLIRGLPLHHRLLDPENPDKLLVLPPVDAHDALVVADVPAHRPASCS